MKASAERSYRQIQNPPPLNRVVALQDLIMTGERQEKLKAAAEAKAGEIGGSVNEEDGAAEEEGGGGQESVAGSKRNTPRTPREKIETEEQLAARIERTEEVKGSVERLKKAYLMLDVPSEYCEYLVLNHKFELPS